MQLYRRPPKPDEFPKKWETTREAAERVIEAQLKKLGKKAAVAAKTTRRRTGKGGEKKKKIFPELWKDYKALFAYAQFEKCGFCESSILATSYGDVEHYRPKSEVSDFEDDVDTQGRQQEASASNKGRKVKLVSRFGYYWLAYDWSNYLLACSICNGQFKGTIFPVKDKPRPVPPQKTNPLEKALLLNPFDETDPSDHLKFQPDGFVIAKSRYGRATIDTCGLFRIALVSARQQIAMRVYQLAQDLKRPPARRQNPQLLRDCYERGADDAEYSGMVRCILKDVAGITWEELVIKRARELALQLKNTKHLPKRKELDADMEKMGRERYQHSAVIRKIFEKTCGTTWRKLVERRALQLATDFLALKRDWEKDAAYELNLKRNLYLMARDNPGHSLAMKEAYEKKCRMDWEELKASVEARFDFLWKLQ